ncbi:MAG: hypothetical protein JSS74_03590, partial [Actinobacteria bacterium]|nr:hypothetical protein [Actinomycetota bacterium]
MGTVIDTRAAMRLLGNGRENPSVAQRFRGVLATQHALDTTTEWSWSAQAADGDEVAVMLTATVPLAIVDDDGAPHEVSAGTLCFLHPHRRLRVIALGTGTAMCSWVPWYALEEIESGVGAPRD